MRPFTQLTKQGQIRRLRQLAINVLPYYNLTDATLKFLQHGENTTFHVQTNSSAKADGPFLDGHYLLRLHGATHNTSTQINAEQVWLKALRDDVGLSVPEPLLAQTSNSFIIESVAPGVPTPRTCSILRWLRGRMYDSPKPHHMEQVGVLMAHLHSHAQQWQPPAHFIRRRWDWEGLFGDNAGFGVDAATVWSILPTQYHDAFRAVADQMAQAMQTLGESNEVFGLIHADLHFGNILFTEGEARAIDFDDCGFGYWIYDIATTLEDWRSTPEWPMWRDALLKGYGNISDIPHDQMVYLDTFIAGRSVSIGLWVVAQAIEKPNFRANLDRWLKNIAELVERYLQHKLPS